MLSEFLSWRACTLCDLSQEGKSIGSLHTDSSRLHLMSFSISDLAVYLYNVSVINLSSEYDSILSPVSPSRESQNVWVVLGTPKTLSNDIKQASKKLYDHHSMNIYVNKILLFILTVQKHGNNIRIKDRILNGIYLAL